MVGWTLLVVGLVLVPGPTGRIGDSQLTASPLWGAAVGLTGLVILLFARRDDG